jgi:hypothetical protein
MTPTEATALLSICAAFDNRKPDKDAATAWSVALGDIRFVDARDAVVAHYRASNEWIMPANVIGEVRRIRAKRIVDHDPLTPPPGLTVAETNVWLREAHARIGDGETINCDAAYGELRPRHLPELRQLTRGVDA